MKRLSKLIVMTLTIAVILVSAHKAQALTIFSNFGPGDTYNSALGLVVSGPANILSNHKDLAVKFTPTGNDFFLDTIELAGWYMNLGTNQLDLAIVTDDFGLPGNIVLESFVLTGLSTTPSIVTADALGSTLLSANTQYWLTASVPNDGAITWNFNSLSPGPATGLATRVDTSWLPSCNTDTPVFRISGTPATPIPEPATMLLLGTGLAGFAGTRLRRKKK